MDKDFKFFLNLMNEYLILLGKINKLEKRIEKNEIEYINQINNLKDEIEVLKADYDYEILYTTMYDKLQE